MFVRLVVSGGPNIGMVAEIQEGFYLVGRNAECQIRPDSSQVADRHCMLQHKGKHFGIMELATGCTTKVNHKQIEHKKWVLLNHSDMLLIGDVAFIVVITAVDPSKPLPQSKSKQAPVKPAPVVKKPTKPKSSSDTSTEQDTAELDASELNLSDEIDQTDLTDAIRWREE